MTRIAHACQALVVEVAFVACGAEGAPTTHPNPPASVSECATPEASWIWCDDVESDRLASYFEFDGAGGRFSRVSGAGYEGSIGMRAQWRPGDQGAGALHVAFGRTPQAYFKAVDAGSADYREIYWRHWVRTQPGWSGGGADKLSRATIFASPSSWAQAMVGHVYSGGPGPNQDYLYIDPASGTDSAGALRTTTYNDFANFRWLGAVRSATALFSSTNAGNWYCVEAHIKLNDAGASTGVMEVWINGDLEIRKSDLNWVGAFNSYGINAVFLEQYWNAGAPGERERFLDGFIVSTQRIGC